MALAHVTLATRDVAKSSEFFQTTLGWKPIPRPGNIDRTADWLDIAPGQQLHLLLVEDFEPSACEREFGRHIALYYPAAGFTALKQRLVENGAELIDPIREIPFERFFFKDPNGYVFEIIEENPIPET